MKTRTMPSKPIVLGAAAIVLLIGTLAGAISLRKPSQPSVAGDSATIDETAAAKAYGKLPLSFEANHGQTDDRVKFLARGGGYSLYLTGDEAVLSLRGDKKTKETGAPATSVLKMKMLGANPQPKASGMDQLPGKTNYFIGNDPAKWRRDLPTYARVKFDAVYPGVDVIYYGAQGRQLEYDFIVAPGADPKAIRLSFVGAKKVELEKAGDLALHLKSGDVRMHKPVVYQEKDGVRQDVSGHYTLRSEGEIGFELGAYDATRPLVIDPMMIYSTFLGGTGQDAGLEIAVNAHGNAFVTGYTTSVDFPTAKNSYQVQPPGGIDAFVTKFDIAGDSVVYSTFIGGKGNENFHDELTAPGVSYSGIALGGTGDAYITGLTKSSDFPTTAGVFQPTLKGYSDAYVVRLNAAGNTLIYSTYLGGSGYDGGQGIAVDAWGQAYITGQDESGDLPVTGLASHSTGCSSGYKDGYIAKLNWSGTALLYSTYFGGNACNLGWGIAVDGNQNAYVMGETVSPDFPTTAGAFDTTCGTDGACGGGSDLFIVKVDTKQSGKVSLQYSTFLGGSGEERVVYNGSVAVDQQGQFIYVTGLTKSVNPADFPIKKAVQATPNGPSDAFITKLEPGQAAAQDQLIYSTYLGGGGDDVGMGLAIDLNGAAYVSGGTGGTFPSTAGETTCSDPGAFVAKFNAAGGIEYATCISGLGQDTGLDVAVDPAGCAYLTGFTESYNFPTRRAFQPLFAGGSQGYPSDAFVTKLCGGLDHFKCYDIKSQDAFPPAFNVLLRDQFENEYVTVSKPVSLCNPVAKCVETGDPAKPYDCGPPMNFNDHLVCYETTSEKGTPKFEQREVVISNQFGKEQRMTVWQRKNMLCLPSLKVKLPSAR
jgi:hypothetical protein